LLTISEHYEKDNHCQLPIKNNAKKNQGDDNVNKSWNDVEENQLEKM